MLVLSLATVALNVYLFVVVPKGFFPQQDTGRMIGGIQADQSISFQLMQQKLTQFIGIVQHGPGGRQRRRLHRRRRRPTRGFVFVIAEAAGASATISADQVIARLRRKLAQVPGASLFLQAVQDIRVGGRAEQRAVPVHAAGRRPRRALRMGAEARSRRCSKLPELADVNTDQQDKGLETDLVIDRDDRLAPRPHRQQIDNTLYDAFGQRQVSTIYNALNQYHVVMEVAPQYWQSPETLKDIYVSTAGGAVGGTQSTNAVAGTVPRARRGIDAPRRSPPMRRATQRPTRSPTPATAAPRPAPRSAPRRDHGAAGRVQRISARQHAARGQPPGPVRRHARSRSTCRRACRSATPSAAIERDDARASACRPRSTAASQGTAQVFQQSLANEPLLILAALVAVYIVLGMLYESYVHPVTILSTLPSAGVGAVLALMLFNTEFSIIALIGVILLIGIVKKNAIMMIDFALDAERDAGPELARGDLSRPACCASARS